MRRATPGKTARRRKPRATEPENRAARIRADSDTSLRRVAAQLASDAAPRRGTSDGETSLRRVAAQLADVAPPRKTSSLRRIAAQLASDAPLPPRESADIAAAKRAVALELIGGRAHYERVIAAVLGAHTSVWIASANVKELMVEDRSRLRKKQPYVSVLSLLDELAARGIELRLLHAELPSRPFRAELARRPRLAGGDLALRRCPRVHLKVVVVDGELLYLGSANWTGAGLGAKGSGRRNFELGIVTDDAAMLDAVQSLYERIWSGGECAGCKLRELCPGPLDEL